MPADNRELSFALNNVQWAQNTLIAGLAGSAARLNMYDSVQVASDMANGEPTTFASQAPSVDEMMKTPIDRPIEGPEDLAGKAIDKIFGREAAMQLFDIGQGHAQGQGTLADRFFGTDTKTASKYVILVLVGLILLGAGAFALMEK